MPSILNILNPTIYFPDDSKVYLQQDYWNRCEYNFRLHYLNKDFRESRFLKGKYALIVDLLMLLKTAKTSFYMRHKILDCIRVFMGTGNVDGVVEMDECLIPESYKGNHKKSGFVMPRPSRKRGKQVKIQL